MAAQSDEPVTGQYVIDNVAIVLSRRPEVPVMVKADEAVPYGRVVEAMVLLQKGGAQEVGFITDPLDPDALTR